MQEDKVIHEIINRITGKKLDNNAKIKLSSAQQYAFITLCRKKGKLINKNLIQNNFSINDILKNKKEDNQIDSKSIKKTYGNSKKIQTQRNLAIGIDIQNIAEFSKLIESKNLRNSSFIKDYFTDSEIKYSESRPDPIETICGIYSVKESIRKTGNMNDFKKIEISHIDGRPIFKNCYISISHSAGICVSVCIQI